MSGLVDALVRGLKLLKHGDDDFFDRLSSRYTTAICLVFAFVVSTGQYAGDPIDCWTPSEFTGQWISYADRYCWVSNTYYVAPGADLPKPGTFKENAREITYYQWTPLILVLQAFFFAFPSVLWSFATHQAGYGVDRVVKLCNSSENMHPEHRDQSIRFLTTQMDRLLGYRREYREGWFSHCKKGKKAKWCFSSIGKRYGFHLVIIYMFVKVLFIGNAVAQLYLMNIVIGEGYVLYGWTVLKNAIQGIDIPESTFFPRVTICHFGIRKLGKNIHTYVLQCVLPINLFNEKIYIFFWWWVVIVISMSIIGLIAWVPTLSNHLNRKFINKYLKIMGRNDAEDKELRILFSEEYLRLDGCFVIRIIAKNVTDLTTGEIVTALYDNFKAYSKKQLHHHSPVCKRKQKALPRPLEQYHNDLEMQRLRPTE